MKASELRRPLAVLVVDDNAGDRVLIRRALEDLPILLDVHDAGSVEEALTYLEPDDEGDRAPDMMLLDLNLPGRSGHDLLREREEDARLRKIPTIVLSGSSASRDVDRAYALCANGYLCKGGGPEDLRRGIRALGAFFLSEAQLPGPGRSSAP